MSTINGNSYQDPRNINLRGGAGGSGLIRWNPGANALVNGGLWGSNPFASDDYGLYINAAGNLAFSSLGSVTVLGAAGGGGAVIPTWAQIFAANATFQLAGTTWTIDDSTAGANNLLTITDTGAGSGNLIQITNTGTGKDINGTSATWYVTKLGASLFLSVDSPTFQSTVGNVILKATGAGVVTIGANTNTITIAKAATFSSTITVTDGLSSLTSTSNTAQALLVVNNSITTYGAAATSAGQVVISSTSITTGSLLKLQAAEGTITGYYLNVYDSVAPAVVFSIRAKGATVIAGSAFATAALTLTAGDAVISSGKLLVTAASNAGAMAVLTNNTATSVSLLQVAGSGTHTGVTTSSFVSVAQTGGTAGTTLYVSSSTATNTVAVVDISAAALTTGSALRITPGSGTFVAGGKSLEINHGSAVAGNGITVTTTGAYTGTGLILVTAGASTTGILVSLVSTTGLTSGSLLRATSSTAGAIATNGAVMFEATGAFTSASNVGYVNVVANSSVAGTIMSISGSGLTTGVGLYISDIAGTGITSGSLLLVTSATTSIVATNGVVSLRASGAYTSTANAGLLDVQSSALVGAGTLVNIKLTNASQTAAVALNIEQTTTGAGYTGTFVRIVGTSTTGASKLIGVTAANTTAGDAFNITNNALTLGAGTLINLVHGTSVIGAGSSMLRITSTGADTGTTTGCLVDLASSTATAGTLVLLTSATLATGSAMVFNINGLTSGVGFSIAHTTTVIVSGGSLARLSSTSIDTGTTTGNLLDLSSTASLAGTQVLATFSGLTTGIGVSIVAAALSTGSALSITAAGAGLTGAGAGIIVTANGSSSSNGLVQISGTGLTTGVGLLITAAAATLTTGAYISCNDGTVNVFRVGLGGHIQTRGTAPSIVVTTQLGITAAAIAASNTDTCGTITTTGTSTGATQITVTFTKAFAFAPKVFLLPANTSAASPNSMYYVDSITTTTFRITVVTAGTYAATPSWYYFVVESGSST